MNGSSDEVENVSSLLTEGGDRCQDALNEAAPLGAMSAVGAIPPEDDVSERSLRGIVGGFDTVNASEGPEGWLEREDATADGGRPRVGARDRASLLEEGPDLLSEARDIGTE